MIQLYDREKERISHKGTEALRMTENEIGKIVVDECIQLHLKGK